MIDMTTETILNILRAFIHDQKPDLEGYIDWNAVFEYAKKHSIKGIVGYICTKYELCTDEQYASAMEAAMINCYGIQLRRDHQMKHLINLLNENSIDHVLMKGYVTREIYPVPELRSYGDIDFLIRKEDRKKTDQLMKQSGYSCHHNWEPVYSYKKDTEFYEIHTELLDSEISDGKQIEYFKDVWNHLIHRDGCTYVMNDEYHIVFLISHLAKHAAKRGAGLRMYLDIALCFEQYRYIADWNYILKQLEILELDKFFNTICNVCKEWFQVDPPCKTISLDEKTIDLFTEVTMRGGTFGFYGSDPALSALKELKKEYSRLDKIKILFHQMFPGPAAMEARYTYLQNRHWLLPVAWVDRIFRNRFLIQRRVDTAKKIVSADESEIVKLRELNKKIGL